jgi:type II secretory pathway pseudopilin PulG
MMNNQKSFTLVELLVSIFIIILLTGIIFANYRQSGNQLALQRAAHKLALDIRRAQEMAMSAKEFEGIIPLGGYGVYFSLTIPYHYVLFADCDGDLQYDAVGNAPDCASATSANPYPESVEGEVIIEKPVSVCEFCGGGSEQTIVFTPPEPEVTITPGGDSTTIVLRNDGQEKTIYVNEAGLIDIRE